MPYRDPIVEEIRAIREQMLREVDYDLEKFVEGVRARQAESGMKISDLPIKRVVPAKNAS